MGISITIPKSRYKQFTKDRNDPRRWGQQFHAFMELEKVTDPDNKVWCDVLYNATEHVGRQMVLASLDHNN